MRDLKKIVCTALAALTIVSSSAAISTFTNGSVFTNSISAEAASGTPYEQITKIINDFKSWRSAYEMKLANINRKLKNAHNPAEIEDLKRQKAECESIINQINDTIKSLNNQISKIYFKKYTGNSNSIVDALKSLKIKSDFNYRKRIAKANNIANYTGTAAQNNKMLSLLKQGKLQNPDATIIIPVINGVNLNLPHGLILLN